jgi:hypothetical protein
MSFNSDLWSSASGIIGYEGDEIIKDVLRRDIKAF